MTTNATTIKTNHATKKYTALSLICKIFLVVFAAASLWNILGMISCQNSGSPLLYSLVLFFSVADICLKADTESAK